MDEVFLEQLQQRRPAAFEMLVERFEPALYRMFLCDHRNHHTAQEQTAETFAQLVRSLPNMRGGPEKLRAFIFGVARHVQQRRWRAKKEKFAPIEVAEDLADRRQLPPDEAVTREEYDSVLVTIGLFEQPLRNVLLLRFVEECSLEEIAEALEDYNLKLIEFGGSVRPNGVEGRRQRIMNKRILSTMVSHRRKLGLGRRNSWRLHFGRLCLLALGSVTGLVACGPSYTALAPGMMLPTIEVDGWVNAEVSQSDLAGNVVVIEAFATW